MFLFKVIEKLNEYKIPYAIVGGHAVALHGAVRGTVDIDFITEWQLVNLQKIEQAMNDLGLKPFLPITAEELFKNKETFITQRNLIAWNFVNHSNPTEQIDIIINSDLADKSVETIEVKKHNICVLSKSDLIEMKKKSAREQDMLDIAALEEIDEN